jgi:hypothetical protein
VEGGAGMSDTPSLEELDELRLVMWEHSTPHWVIATAAWEGIIPTPSLEGIDRDTCLKLTAWVRNGCR